MVNFDTSTTELLLRLAVVLGTTWSLQITSSNPNPPPSKEEKREVSVVERRSRNIVTTVIRFTYGLVGALETIIIVARLVVRTRSKVDLLTGTCVDDLGLRTSSTVIGCILAVIGALTRLWCYRTLGRLFTFEFSLLPQHKLITSGPYAIVRHPSYTAAILAFAGAMIVYATRGALTYECPMGYYLWTLIWGLLLVITLVVGVDRCIREDELLHRTFGEEWERWSRRVRWRLVPWIF